MRNIGFILITLILSFLNVCQLYALSNDELEHQIKEIDKREKMFHLLENSNKGLMVLYNAKKVEDDIVGEVTKVFQKCNLPLSTGFGWLLKGDKKMSDVTLNSIRDNQDNVKKSLEILAQRKKEIQEQLKKPEIQRLKSFKGVIDLPSPDDHKAEIPTPHVASPKAGQVKSVHKGEKINLEHYENMSKADLRKELGKKLGSNAKYDKMSKRELISALTGVPKEKIHASSSDKGKESGKDLDHYENMSKSDLRKEMEKKFGHNKDYDKMSAREMVSALTGVSKEKVHMDGKDKEEEAKKDKAKAKDLDRYENMSKKELRDKLEKKTGHKDNYDKMSKRELISALTGVPKDKITKDEKDKKDHAEAKADDGPKKDGKEKSQATKLTKQQVEQIWKARPDVQQNVQAKKKGDPYEKTQTWWDKYGQKEMGNFFTSAPAPASPPAAASTQKSAPSPTSSSSSPGLNPTKKLSKAQIEEIWKTRADVSKDASSHKGADPYKQTQKWWDNYGRKEMSGYKFAGTPPPPASGSQSPATSSPPATSRSSATASTPTPATSEPATGPTASRPAPSPGAGKEKGHLQKMEQRQAVEKTQRDQQEKQRKEEAKLQESEQRKSREQQERARKEEKQKAQVEEKRRQEEQRKAEQERQRQANLEAKRLQEEQRRQQAEQRKAQEQQRRLEVQRRQQEQAQQEQLRRQNELRQRQAQMEQQRKAQQLQQQQAMQQQLQQEEARRQQAQSEQQRIEAQRRQQQMLQQQQTQQQQPPRKGR